MSAVVDVSTGTVVASIDIQAPPERVFRALTDPRQLATWWGSPDSYRSHDWEVDLRVGGKWVSHTVSTTDGTTAVVQGEYLEIQPPHLLVYTWRASYDNDLPTTIRCELSSTPEGTRVKVRHSGFLPNPASCESHGLGWDRVLGWARAFIEQG